MAKCILSCAATLAVAAAVVLAPGVAWAQGALTVSDADAERASVALPETVVQGGSLPSEKERFAGYVDQVFGEGAPAGGAFRLEVQKALRRDRLNEQEQAVYDRLSTRICAIAAGEEESAVIPIPLSELGVQNSYTAAELGLESVFEADNPAAVSEEARYAVNAKFNVALMRILNAVLTDHPYELYWYDKTAGIAFEPPSLSAIDNNEGGAIVFAVPHEVTFKMCVSGDYSIGGAVGTFAADTARTGAATASAANARAIVEAHAGEDDFSKLHSYMEAVARLTDYDYDAANNYDATGVYGDSWQLVSVFDNDPSTKVVCEGYAKAFQYLCDMSTFSDPAIACNAVTGEMYGGTGSGPHMWNVVAIGAKNYLVDVTNNDNYPDEGSDAPASTTPNDELFLAGAEGSVYDGYRVEWPDAAGGEAHWITYYYDDEMLYFFDEAELALSATSYAQDMQGGGEPGSDPDPDPQPTDAERAKEVYNLINAIGKVGYDARSKAAIDAARAAYNALTAGQRALVGNASALANAEARYGSLKAASDKAAAEKAAAEKAAAEKAAAKEAAEKATLTLNTAKVTKASVKKAAKKAGKKLSAIKTIVLGTKVKRIGKQAFAQISKAKTLVVKTKKLKKSYVKGALSKSKVKTVKVPASKLKAYKKLFTKKACGKKVTLKTA